MPRNLVTGKEQNHTETAEYCTTALIYWLQQEVLIDGYPQRSPPPPAVSLCKSHFYKKIMPRRRFSSPVQIMKPTAFLKNHESVFSLIDFICSICTCTVYFACSVCYLQPTPTQIYIDTTQCTRYLISFAYSEWGRHPDINDTSFVTGSSISLNTRIISPCTLTIQ